MTRQNGGTFSPRSGSGPYCAGGRPPLSRTPAAIPVSLRLSATTRPSVERCRRSIGLGAAIGTNDYDACLEQVDAVYIALPNSMHAEYAIRAAKAGVHVLCEKPMAVTADECEQMIEACRENEVRLMIAYRLHFEEVNLKAVDLVRRRRIGEPKFFNSSFSMIVKPNNIRTQSELGGGTLYDIGVYCINAARYLFRAEPKEVMAVSVNTGKNGLEDIDESTGALLRFDGKPGSSPL